MKWLLENTLLRFGLSQPHLMLGIVGMIVIAAFLLYPKMNKDFLPKFQEETALVSATAAPGTSLEEMNKISDVIEQQILSAARGAQGGPPSRTRRAWRPRRARLHGGVRRGFPRRSKAQHKRRSEGRRKEDP